MFKKLIAITACIAGIFADALVCKQFDIMPIYFLTAPILAILGSALLMKLDEK